MPTAIWSSRWRSGSAHWDLELAVEVRQCPLGSGAHGGGPAVPTGIWTARRRTRRRWRRRRRRRRTALIKSNNPHLAGGEQMPGEMARNICIYIFIIFYYIILTQIIIYYTILRYFVVLFYMYHFLNILFSNHFIIL